MATPRLRFKEYQDEWSEKRFSSIASFSKGSLLSKGDLSEDGTPCILYGELYTKYGEVIDNVKSKTSVNADLLTYGKSNDVLIPSSGETALDIATASCLQIDDVALGGDLNIITPHYDSGIFISYQLNNVKRKSIAKVAQGASVVHLYNEALKKLRLHMPSIPEQKKIAKTISLLDRKIALQRQKIKLLNDYKMGVFDAIFGDEYTDDWERVTVSDMLEYERPDKYIVENTNYLSEGTPVLTANKGFILGYTNEQTGIYEKANCIIFDDFTLDFKYVNFPFKVKSSAMKILTTKNGYSLRICSAILERMELAPESHARHWISVVQPMSVTYPPKAKTKCIENILFSFDRIANIAKAKEENLLKLKSSLLQQMFV